MNEGPAYQPSLAEQKILKLELGPEKALEAFQREKLLARVLDNPHIARSSDGFELSYEVLRRELDDLEGEGLKYASSTLIIPDHDTPLYLDKSAGWLFDGNDSEIKHVASQDSGSSGGTEESFRANSTNLQNLDELASEIRSSPGKKSMNEVNANFTTRGLVGVVVRKSLSPRTLLSGIILHKFMLQQGYSIPIFIFDQDLGKLEQLQYTDEDAKSCIAQLNVEKMKEIYYKAIEQLNS